VIDKKGCHTNDADASASRIEVNAHGFQTFPYGQVGHYHRLLSIQSPGWPPEFPPECPPDCPLVFLIMIQPVRAS
jgi:hypothetical protein